MDKRNIQFINNITKTLCNKNVKYRFIDARWKERGDIDFIVSKDSIKKFEHILKKYGFERKGLWPPQSRVYRKLANNEIIIIGAHIGGFKDMMGGLGSTGKIFNPKNVKEYNNCYLSNEEQIFILLYKAMTRNNIWKYNEYFSQIIKNNINYDKLNELLFYAFTNPKQIIKKIKGKEKLANIKPRLRKNIKIKIKIKSVPRVIFIILRKIIKPGLYIALVGCNGAGKSTTMKNLAKKLSENKVKVKTFYHGRCSFQILPLNFIVKRFKPDKIERGENYEKGEIKPNGKRREYRIFHSKILNFIAPIAYYIDYSLRYFLKIYPARLNYDVVLTDRAFIDIFNSPNNNKTVCKILYKLFPRQKMILLWNDLEVLLKRRPEFQLRHIKEQLRIYNKFSSDYFMCLKTENYYIVDNILDKIGGLI